MILISLFELMKVSGADGDYTVSGSELFGCLDSGKKESLSYVLGLSCREIVD